MLASLGVLEQNMNKKTGTRPPKIRNGDLMRVTVGPLKDAEGLVTGISEKVSKKGNRRTTFVEIRQLNGNPIRLPAHHFEFASMRPREYFE